MDLSRRSVVLLGAASVLAGCSSAKETSAPPTASPRSSPAASASPAPTPSPSPSALPRARPWQPSPGDREPDCKRTAARYVEQHHTSGGEAVDIVFCQYGGLLTDAASVLVVTRSWTRVGTSVVAGGRTYDVRLQRRGGRWRVDAVHPSRPGPRAATLSPAARRVLRSDRIELPPAASRDVAAGRVHDVTLRALLSLSATYRVGISVLRSGHPIDVFGTDRPSDHPLGRAFDTWRIDGRQVVDPRTPRALVTEYMHAAAEAGSYNVGGPYLLGSAPQYFSDDTHHDHVHAGFLD